MKLYTVSIKAEFMAFAKSPDAARALVRSFLSMEGIDEDDCTAAESGGSHANGWDDECLVYGPEDGMTVAEARRLSARTVTPTADTAPPVSMWDEVDREDAAFFDRDFGASG